MNAYLSCCLILKLVVVLKIFLSFSVSIKKGKNPADNTDKITKLPWILLLNNNHIKHTMDY